MAGIGFELKKMFSKKGLLSALQAYGYAGVVCVGPIILGVALLFGISALAGQAGADEHTTRLLNNMVTYTLLISMVLTNTFSLVTTRFTADQIFINEKNKILASFWGSICIMLVVGGIGYGVFLSYAGISLLYQILCLVFFGELVFVWTEMNYLTAIKDYKGIMITFFCALVAAWTAGYGLIHIGMDIITALMLAVIIGYGLMMCIYYYLIALYFPKKQSGAFYFLKWADRYPQLAPLGAFISLGLFGHLVIMWTGNAGQQIQGLFYGAPTYDIPALLAFLSILVTTINFVTSVEVNFYPQYRNYFSLFNDGGSLMDIEQAEKEMKATLSQELTYTFTKQLFATVVFIVAGTFLLPLFSLGMTEDMLGIYRVLCIGYAFYAVGNCAMLLQLYFSDNTGALISVSSFMVVSCIGTFALRNSGVKFYGLGFLMGSMIFAFVSLGLLAAYLSKIRYHVLCKQPIIKVERATSITRLSDWSEKHFEKKNPRKAVVKADDEL